MTQQVQRPTGRDLTHSNNREFIYLKGNESTDGSLRIIPGPSGEQHRFQLRATGVWNDTGIQVAAATIALGRDVLLSAAGDWLQVSDNDGDVLSLTPHIEFDDFGTVPLPHFPVLQPKQFRDIVQPDDSQERIGTFIHSIIPSPIKALRTKLYYRTGSVIATQPVMLTIQKENLAGPVIFEKEIPASSLGIPNFEFSVDIDGAVEFDDDENVSILWTSAATFSIRGNASNQNWVALDLFPLSEESLVSNLVGVNRFLTDSLGDTLADNQGNLLFERGIDT